MRIINVRQRRIIVPTVRRYPAHHGIGEIDRAPTTDPVFRVRRYVWNMECAERRGECKPASQPMAVRLARRGVAGRAPCGIEHDASADRIAKPVELGRLLLGKGRVWRR